MSDGKCPICSPEAGEAVGKRLIRLDGQGKVDGSEVFGADEIPAGTLGVRAVRCPHDRARFQFGDFSKFISNRPGIELVLTAKDVPGVDCYGVIPKFADQSVFAHNEARYRGEAVAAIVGEADVLEALDLSEFPVTWEQLPPIRTIDEGLADDAPRIHGHREQNVLVRGRVVRGDVDQALAESEIVVEGEYETGFVEHAYIEPEAGFARRVGDTIEIQACTQSPYMDRNDIAKVMGLAPEKVRIIPTAVGGGFRIEARSFCAAIRRAGGLEAEPAGSHGLFTHRVDCFDHQAPSSADETARGGDPRGQADCTRFFR